MDESQADDVRVWDVQVRDDPDGQRYEARVADALAGAAYHQLADDLISFTHTEVDHAREGHGVGSSLVRFALDDARRRDLRVVHISRVAAQCGAPPGSRRVDI